MKTVARLAPLALGAAGVLYPFGVYFSLNRLPMAWLLVPLAALWGLRAWCAGAQFGGRSVVRSGGRAPALLLLGFCLLLAASPSELGVRAYPVLVSLVLLGVFGASLRAGATPVIERIARLAHPDLPPEGVRYTRHITLIWCGFFVCNGTLAAVLALWGSWAAWTLYNGAISYALMGLLLLGEWCARPRLRQSAGRQGSA